VVEVEENRVLPVFAERFKMRGGMRMRQIKERGGRNECN
jgi:hypothetical protein